jgi:uncharacterized membrane protein YesL
MKIGEVWKQVRTVFLSLFPSPRSYLNFWVMWIFFTVLVLNHDPMIVLIAAFATCYFLNEWTKEMQQPKEKPKETAN